MKIIKSRLHNGEGVVEVAILRSEMLRAYMLLDLLNEDIVGEVYFNDSAMHQRLCIQISEEATYIPETGCVMITNNHVACLKRFLSQCYLNPYDMKWLHEDIEMGISQGKDVVLHVHFEDADY